MKSHFFALTALAMLIGLTLTPIAGIAAAQETASPTTTATATPTGEQTTIQLSPTTRVSGWTYQNGTFSITVVSKTPTRVTLTDAGALSKELSASGGATSSQIPQRTVNVGSGETTIEFRGTQVDGEAAVTLTALGADRLVLLRSGSIGGGRPPVDYGTAQALVGAAAIAAAGGTFWYVKRRREAEQKEVKRIW